MFIHFFPWNQSKPVPSPLPPDRPEWHQAVLDGYERSFPHLEDFSVLAPPDPSKRCFAHALGLDYNRWPGSGSLVAMEKTLVGQHGCQRVPQLPNDFAIEAFVVYGQGMRCRHIIRRRPDGIFESKNGRNWALAIHHPKELAGGLYGDPIAIFTRPLTSDESTPGSR